jgi:hypothetical protein
MTAPDAPLPAPTQQDYDEARTAIDAKWPTNGVAKAIATARRAGFRAGIESAAKLMDEHAAAHGLVSVHVLAVDAAAAIRALSPDAERGE